MATGRPASVQLYHQGKCLFGFTDWCEKSLNKIHLNPVMIPWGVTAVNDCHRGMRRKCLHSHTTLCPLFPARDQTFSAEHASPHLEKIQSEKKTTFLENFTFLLFLIFFLKKNYEAF